MKYFSFATTFTDAVGNLSGVSLEDDYKISENQFIDCFKQIPKGMQYDKIRQ